MTSTLIARLRPLALLAVAGSLGACHVGDVGGNVVRNAFGNSGRAGDVVAAGFQSAVDIVTQHSIRFSPEQEYYLGRGIAAAWIARYGLDADETRQAYVRQVGAAIVDLSGRVRTTYGGWHFAVLSGDKPNGLSAPGGFVFVTRAALDQAHDEDQLAGLLCHEIAHVSLKHGEKILQSAEPWKAKIGAVGRLVGAAGGGARQSQNMYELYSLAADHLAVSLSEQGYGGEYEDRADAEGTLLLYDCGYDGAALSQYLGLSSAGGRWGSHGDPASRVTALAGIVSTYGGPFDGGVGLAARTKRFEATLGGK